MRNENPKSRGNRWAVAERLRKYEARGLTQAQRSGSRNHDQPCGIERVELPQELTRWTSSRGTGTTVSDLLPPTASEHADGSS